MSTCKPSPNIYINSPMHVNTGWSDTNVEFTTAWGIFVHVPSICFIRQLRTSTLHTHTLCPKGFKKVRWNPFAGLVARHALQTCGFVFVLDIRCLAEKNAVHLTLTLANAKYSNAGSCTLCSTNTMRSAPWPSLHVFASMLRSFDR